MAENQNLSSPNDDSYDPNNATDNDGDGVGLSLDLGDDNEDETNLDEEQIRQNAGLNSPKGEVILKLYYINNILYILYFMIYILLY